MKTALTFSIIVVIAIGIFLPQYATAQSPEKMSYQAVIRNNSNQLVSNQIVGMRISILLASANGTEVYTETQTPTTNTNGLVSIEIGEGAGFGSIDWTNGPYFIKTETDLNGGTNYTITGTSQILSVPYALHAKTAENLTGSVTETDPVYLASQASNIIAIDITNLGNLSGINTGDQDLSALATKTALGDSTAQLRSEIPELSGFITEEVDPTWFGNANLIENIGRTGNVGIGISTPAALLHTNGTGIGDGNVLFRGLVKEVSAGDPPEPGIGGTLMMWYPDKAAFRVGAVNNEFCVKEMIGNYSVALGCNPLAKGNYTFATGYCAAAEGEYSAAIGMCPIASGMFSTAIGGYTFAKGDHSTALGYGSKALGNYSFAINLGSTRQCEVGDNTFWITSASLIGGNVGWTQYSDQRLEKDIQTLCTEDNLAKIRQLNGIRFRWIANDNLLNLGFVAQDVKDIIPESVRFDEYNNIYSMEYAAIIPVLVEGIKEQQKLIESQQSEINSLQEQKAYFDVLQDKLELLTNTLKGVGFISDIDGNEYNTVKIGDQVWMAENLKTTKYNDGTAIPLVTDNSEWNALTTPGYSWYNNNKNNYANTYGALYNWHTVNTDKLCPVSWHVPTNDEWTILENYLIANGYNFDDSSDDDGDRTTLNRIAKALGSTANWIKSEFNGAVGNTDYPLKRNLSGFSARPGGIRENSSGSFHGIGWLGFWWTSSEYTPGYSARFWYRRMHYNSFDVGGYLTFAREGLSVRCVKD